MKSNGVVTNSSQPVNVWSPYDNPRAEFFVASQGINTNNYCATACNGLTVYAVSNPFGFVSSGPNPEVSSFNIATANNYTVPPDAVQAGSSSLVWTDFTRITGEATYSSGSIFAALPTDNGASGVASIFYRLRPTLNANDNTNCTGSWANYCPQINGLSMQDETLLNYGTTTAAFFPVQHLRATLLQPSATVLRTPIPASSTTANAQRKAPDFPTPEFIWSAGQGLSSAPTGAPTTPWLQQALAMRAVTAEKPPAQACSSRECTARRAIAGPRSSATRVIAQLLTTEF